MTPETGEFQIEELAICDYRPGRRTFAERIRVEEFKVKWVTGEEVGRSTAEGWVLQSDLGPAEWLRDALDDTFKRWQGAIKPRVSSIGTLATFLYDCYFVSPLEPWVEGESAYLTQDISMEMVKILRGHADGADECWATYWLGSNIFNQAQLQAPRLQLSRPVEKCTSSAG
ncbi:MAG: hypothetical protein IPK93_10440 [Solirubrobacterales bacterium]|nr:hypothetical protein [Solirubrobacterales bacterium]